MGGCARKHCENLTGDLFANVFHGSGASLTNIPGSALPGNVIYNDQANIYTAGSKQTFKASATLAGLNIFGVATDPTGPLAAGDAWYNTTANRLKFYNGTVSKNLAFTDDSITGNASTASAFDHTPTQCSANNFATGIAVNGNANCSQPSFANLSGTATNSQLTNSSLTVSPGTGLAGGGTVSLGSSTTLNLANTAVTAGTYTAATVTVDPQGRITAASSNTVPNARAVFTGYCLTLASTTSVFVPGYGGNLGTNANSKTCQSGAASGGMPVTSAGNLKNLFVVAGSAGTNSNEKVTVLVNGSTALTCTYGTGTSCNSGASTFAVTAGQVITIAVQGTVNVTASNVSVAFEFN